MEAKVATQNKKKKKKKKKKTWTLTISADPDKMPRSALLLWYNSLQEQIGKFDL